MNYREATQYLYNQLPMFHRIGAAAYKDNLDNTLAICRLLGNPEQKFRSVHIAGTNGKGSVSHMLASILQEAGYKTGLFTSPHLKDFRERIRVQGKMIPKTGVIGFISEHRNAFDKIQPSFFEWTWGLAADHFAKEKVDIAVIETGLGGRLDSTNVIRSDLAVITNIGYDHMQFLGDTLSKIAGEKAGIIKTGIPVVIGETHPETEGVFEQTALSRGAGISFADREIEVLHFGWTRHAVPLLKADFRHTGMNTVFHLACPLAGSYQLKNLATVLAAVANLQQAGYAISPDHIARGVRKVIANTGLKGRWQVIGHKPLTVADIGHNRNGIESVVQQISLTPHDKLLIVLGVVNDKDVEGMLKLLPHHARYYFCKADIPRGLDAEILRQRAGSAGLNGNSCASVKEALEQAQAEAGENDLVLVTGSAFVVAEAV